MPDAAATPDAHARAVECARAIADAWQAGRWLDAYGLIAAMWPDHSEPAQAYRRLRDVVGDDSPAPEADLDSQRAEARNLLTQAAAKVQLHELPPSRQQWMLEDLLEKCRANPRLDWLADSVGVVARISANEEPLKVAVLGIFNSGKSSLINSMIGAEVLRTGIIPVTATLTELCWAETPEARVRYFDGREQTVVLDKLAELTDEREGGNPAATVERVTIGYPAEILKRFTLLDTPGFNSGYDLHELVTERVVLDADVVLWVFNATRAGSETEAKELLHVERSVGKAIGIVNHIDDLDPSWKRNRQGWQESLNGVVADLQAKLGQLITRWVPVSALWMRERHPAAGADVMQDALDDLASRAVAVREAARKRHRAGILQMAVALDELQRREQTAFDEHQQRQRRAEAEFVKSAAADWQEELELTRRSAETRKQLDSPELLPRPYSSKADALERAASDGELPGTVMEAWMSFERAAWLLRSPLAEALRNIMRGAAAIIESPFQRFWTVEFSAEQVRPACAEGIERIWSIPNSFGGDWREAVGRYIEGTRAQARRAENLVADALLHEAADNYDAALVALREAAACNPGFHAVLVDATARYPDLMPRQYAREQMDHAAKLKAERDYEGALAMIERAAELHPQGWATEAAEARATFPSLIAKRDAAELLNRASACEERKDDEGALALIGEAFKAAARTDDEPLKSRISVLSAQTRARLRRLRLVRALGACAAVMLFLTMVTAAVALYMHRDSQQDGHFANVAISKIETATSEMTALKAREEYHGSGHADRLDEAYRLKLKQFDEQSYLAIRDAIAGTSTAEQAKEARAAYNGARYGAQLDADLAKHLERLAQEADKQEYERTLAQVHRSESEAQAREARATYKGLRFNEQLDNDLVQHIEALRIAADRRDYERVLAQIHEATTEDGAKKARLGYMGSGFGDQLDADLAKHLDALRLAAIQQEIEHVLTEIRGAQSWDDAQRARQKYSSSNFSVQLDDALKLRFYQLMSVERTITGHDGWVRSVEFSQDNKWILTASGDGNARLWDVESGRKLRSFVGHKGWINRASFSPDGTRVVTAGNDKTVRLWNASTGLESLRLVGHTDWVNTAGFSPDGKLIVSASSDKTVRLWDASTGEELRRLSGHTESVNAASFSPDGNTIVSASNDKTAMLWNTSTGLRIRTLLGHEGWVTAAVFSSNGKQVITASGDKSVRWWSVETGKATRTLARHKDSIMAVAQTSDGRFVLTAGYDGVAKVFSSDSDEPIRDIKASGKALLGAVFSPDGSRVATAGADGNCRIWSCRKPR